MSADVYQAALDDADIDQFYSLPPTRGTSRHVSLTPNRPADEKHITLESFMCIKSALRSARLSVGANDPTFGIPTEGSSPEVHWIPSSKHQPNPKHHHFCAKPIINRFCKARLSSPEYDADVVPHQVNTRSPFPEEPFTIEQLVSPPAAPVITERWSSTSIGSTLPAAKSYSPGDICPDDPNRSRENIETIVHDICTYLSGLRHDDCPLRRPQDTSTNHGKMHGETDAARDNVGSFLVSTDDIAEILEIVITGLRDEHGEQMPFGCLTALLGEDHNTRPSTMDGSIVPTASCLAEPATTISSVKPSFSMIGHEGTSGVNPQSTKATIISKQSVTEVS